MDKTDHMEDIKIRFQHDYNEAIDNYNSGDCVLFFRNIRPAIETFCKLVIFDLVDTVLAEELLSGQKTLHCDYKNCTAAFITPTNRAVENSMLASLAQQVIYYTKGVTLALYSTQRTVNRIKSAIDSDFVKLASDFKNSSEAGMHDGVSTVENEIEARNLSTFMPKVFSDLRTILSNETIAFLSTLNKPLSNVTFQSSCVESSLKTSNDFLVFDELTNRMEQAAGLDYVIILPEFLNDHNGHPLSKERLADFFQLHWSFVVDLDAKTEFGLYENAPSHVKSSTRIITDKLSEVSGTSNLTNWIFGKGRLDLGAYDDRKALRETPKLFANTFSKLVKTGKTNDYIIIDFCDNFPKLAQRIFEKLEIVFGSWESVANRCKIISFTKNDNYKDELTSWSEDYDVPVCFVSASFSEFLQHIKEIRGNVTMVSSKRLLIHNNKLDLSESIERYKASGIEFYGPTKNTAEERPWDFYSGAEITWEELDKQHDVIRDIYRNVKLRVSEIIRTTRRTQIYTLRHRPGSGATTLARRLAFDIRKEDEIGAISCTVIDIKNCSNIKLTEQYLCQLSEQTENTVILAIVESKHVAKDKFENLVKRMSDAAKKVLFFYIEPYTRRYHTQKENVILLDSYLKTEELQRFVEKYTTQGLEHSILEGALKNQKILEVVDFPLMLKDKETSTNLSTYVSEWMDELPDNLRKFCAYVGFVFKYSDLGVNQRILKSLWKDEFHQSLRSYTFEQQHAISKLLIEEMNDDGTGKGIWRPRYNRFSEFILEAYKTNWELGLSEIAKDFISLCQNAGELGSDDRDMLYSVFIIRKNADYRAIEDSRDNIKNKFSLLIKDLDDIERAESLFKTLVDAFPEDAIFRGHFARFLYEKASMLKGIEIDDRLFSDAQDNLNMAFDLNSNDADLFHMQGMLLRRKISALSKSFTRDMLTNPEDVNLQDAEDCLHEWTQDAYEAFEQSIQISPASPYGYAAESQLFKESITLGQKIIGCNDYSFCETNSRYSDYAEKLGNVLDLFEQICYAFKNEGLSQIMNSYPIYESVRAFHQNIVGLNAESIQRYRTMYNSATKENKSLYGNLLVKSIVYSKKSSKDTRRAYSNLTKSERMEIEEVLEYQKNQGDVKSYETLFLLKLYGPDEFSIDEAIDLLKEWEHQFSSGDQIGWGYLNACFYLAVCYSAKSILAGVPNKELSQLAMTYFHKSEDFAKRFDKGTVQPLCYLGEKEDIHCIVDKNRKDTDACTVTGVIQHVNNNKGILKMLCGIDVSFKANRFDKFHAEGQTLRGVLGFSYSGPGLYDFRPDIDDELTGLYMDVQDEKEISFDELAESYVPTEDLVEEEHPEAKPTEAPQSGIKQVGYIDPATFPTSRKSNPTNKATKKNKLVDGVDYEGIIIIDGGYKKIKCDIYPYPLKIEDRNTDYYEDEIVFFTAKSRPNDRDANKTFWYATNVRLKED